MPARRSPIGTSYHSRDSVPASANGHRETAAEIAGPVVDAELVPERVDQIIQHEAAADQKASEAEEHRWEAARLISEELADGKSQVRLADEIGKSETHVRYMRKA